MVTLSAIQLENIGKCYRIYANPQDRFKQALRDRFGQWLGNQNHPPLYREHWALRDVSFSVAPGEAVGILGRNGAGKSTLLQIIAGTLSPTTGCVETNGRITALLELGSGFNPEFTGRENVFHNAQILGLTRQDAEDKFDDIASFADIGDFIDQPVKTYSSGMIMRLAFAVQTAVEPKVLIVDEALSVGDMFFQAKCMARISRLVDDGVTLLFVSHDSGSVRQLCSKALLFEGGRLVGDGSAARVSDQYQKTQLEDRNRLAQSSNTTDQENGTTTSKLASHEKFGNSQMNFGIEAFHGRAASNRTGNRTAEIINVQMLRGKTHAVDFDYDDLVNIRVYVLFNVALTNVNHSLVVRTVQGSNVVFMDTRLQGQMDREYLAGHIYCFQWSIRLPLMHLQYGLGVGVAHPPKNPGEDWEFVDIVPHAYEFKMNPRIQGMIDGFVALPADLVVTVETSTKNDITIR